MKHKTLWLPLAAFALLAAAPGAWAQNAPAPRPDPQQRQERVQERLDHHLERLALTLDLSSAQKAQVREIMETQMRAQQAKAEQQRAERQAMTAEQRRAQAEKRRTEGEARRTAMEQQREQTQAAIRAVLTTEQAQKFDALRALEQEHRTEMREHRGKRMEHRGERMQRRGRRMQQGGGR